MRSQKISSRIKNRLIFLIIIISCFSSSIYLISYALKDKISYFYSPSEIKELEIDSTQTVRVGGLLKKGSLKIENNIWFFDVVDENDNSVSVVFDKTLPNLVRENKGIIVEGKIMNNILNAKNVLAKHDENYMPQSAIDKMKDKGVWRGE